jgi:hypothetical protein
MTHQWTHARHLCGRPILFALTFNGYQEFPIFALPNDNSPTGRVTVSHCPNCGLKFNLNDCTQEAGHA